MQDTVKYTDLFIKGQQALVTYQYKVYSKHKFKTLDKKLNRAVGIFSLLSEYTSGVWNGIYTDFYHKLAIQFSLHPKLSLNLTFGHIYFSSSSINMCSLGNLSVRSSFAFYDQKYASVLYCGMYTHVKNFPGSAKVHIKLLAFPRTIFDILLSYSVIDSNTVLTFSGNGNSVSNSYVWSLLFPQMKSFVDMYHVSVKKMYRLVVALGNQNCCHFQLFDGPGAKSKTTWRHMTEKPNVLPLLHISIYNLCISSIQQRRSNTICFKLFKTKLSQQ